LFLTVGLLVKIIPETRYLLVDDFGRVKVSMVG